MPGFTAEKPNLRADKALAQYAKGMAMTPLRTSMLKPVPRWERHDTQANCFLKRT